MVRSFAERAKQPNLHPIAKSLCQIIERKQSNLCLSADVSSMNEVLALVEAAGPSICILKVHADMIDDFSRDHAKSLSALASEYEFLIFEDRKFGDIGSTVQKQYIAGPLRIADWADIVNAHIFPGPAIVQALKSALPSETRQRRALLLLAEMSSEGNLMDRSYTTKCVELAREHRDFVMGFIAQHDLNELQSDQFFVMTPGVSLPPAGQVSSAGDGLGQQYNTPSKVILDNGCDIIIVGRGITNARDRKAEAERYRAAGWEAYQERAGREAAA